MKQKEKQIIKEYLIKYNRESEINRILSDISQLNTEINRNNKESIFNN